MSESPHEVLEAALKRSGHSPAMQKVYRQRFGTAMLYWAIDISRDSREESDSAHWLRDAGFGGTSAEDDERRTGQ